MAQIIDGNASLPSLRWGILGTGWVSTVFTGDLVLPRSDATTHHQVVAVGTSSIEKGNKFVAEIVKPSDKNSVKVHDSYQALYNNPNVDIVYVGTPHSAHMQNCLDAISAGKHVLCEKPFAINSREAKIVVEAARQKNVFVMEGMWTRFFPLVKALQKHLHESQTIGRINRVFTDFGLNSAALPASSSVRVTDPAMGAGALLDIGVYSLVWASIALGENLVGTQHPKNKVTSVCGLAGGIDESNVVILDYPDAAGSRMAICTSTLRNQSPEGFCRIEGEKGVITVFGPGPSHPQGFRISFPKNGEQEAREEVFDFSREGFGFYYEADAIARDIHAGRTENETMPLDETLRIMALMDNVRKSGGVVYPQDNV